ncbi:MAG: aspartyl/asparaginyl beta-hydroxylase domain-containing protein [Myxococcota bacterium]
MERPAWRDRPRARLIHWLKHTGRPGLNAYLARHSLVGDPEVFENDTFPWSADLERGWPVIRRDALRALELRDHIPAFQEVSPDQYRISDTDEWKTFWYRGFGHRSRIFAELFPDTARLVDAVPGVETAFFSIIAPGKHIIAHRGVYKGFINYHLGVLVPRDRERCRMRVGAEHFFWEEGKSRIFDDTYEHEVWNETDEERVVLMLQIRRPLRAPGRQVSEIFLRALKRTPYVTVALSNQLAFEDRLRAAVQRGN